MTFPLLNIINVLLDDGRFSSYGSSAAAWYSELLIRHLRLLTYVVRGAAGGCAFLIFVHRNHRVLFYLMDLLCVSSHPSSPPFPLNQPKIAAVLYHWTFDLDRARELRSDWMLFLWGRNLLVGGLMYGGWHVFLYVLPAIRDKV